MSKLPNIRTLLQALRDSRRAKPSAHTGAEDQLPLIDEQVTDTGYYSEISFRYHSVQIICIMLLAVFLAVTLMTNARALSADNLIYFAKDLATTVASKEKGTTDVFVYASDENNDYTLYREGLVTLGKQKLTVFTATGREAYSYFLSYQNPRLASSGRYFAAYDMGGRGVSLYNSFTCVNELTTEMSVRTVAVCDKGYYCLVTNGAEYASEVLLYNERHHMINRYRLKEYTVMADLCPDGSELMLVSVAAELGRMVTHIDFAIPGEPDWSSSFDVLDAYPVACLYTEDGNILLLSTDAVYLFDRLGEELGRYYISSSEVVSFEMTREACVIVCHEGVSDRTNRVLVFDKTGNLEYNVSVTAGLRDACYMDGILAILCDESLWMYQGEAEQPVCVALTGDYHTLLAYDGSEFLLCGDAKAVAMKPQ